MRRTADLGEILRDSGSGRVVAVVMVFVLAVGGAIVGLKMYHHFRPRLSGGATTPPTSLTADHIYNLTIRYTIDGTPPVRIDAIHIPKITGLDLSVNAVTCKAGIMKKSVTEGPNLANSVYGPALSPRAYMAAITRKVYGYKIGSVKNPTMCAVLTVHSHDPATYHLGPFTLDWRAGLFVGTVHDQTDLTLTFVS